MKIQNIMIMGLAALALTSCKSLYGTYQRPNVNTRGIVRDSLSMTDTLVVTDTTSFGNMPWRSVFTDPQLQTHIERALTNNVDLLNAALNVKMAEAQLKAGNEVSNALVLYHSSDEKSKIEAKQIQTLQQNVEDTKLLLSQSSSTYLEVITAQQTLLNAQMAKITDDFHKMQAVVNLYQALGGGVK